jgi:hypothetical protein
LLAMTRIARPILENKVRPPPRPLLSSMTRITRVTLSQHQAAQAHLLNSKELAQFRQELMRAFFLQKVAAI